MSYRPPNLQVKPEVHEAVLQEMRKWERRAKAAEAKLRYTENELELSMRQHSGKNSGKDWSNVTKLFMSSETHDAERCLP